MKKLKFFLFLIIIIGMIATINFYLFPSQQYPCYSYPQANLEEDCENFCKPDSLCAYYIVYYPGYCSFPYGCGNGKCNMTVKFYCEDASRAYKTYNHWSGFCYKSCY